MIVVLFFIKSTTTFKNPLNSAQGEQENGLTYSNPTLEESVNKDTDGDGIPDWEESLYGLDPTKKETTPGIPDSVAIEKLKLQQTAGANVQINTVDQTTENLTQTDKFSRELFTTVAAASQNGTMDQTTIDQLSASLADQIQNSVPRKVFLISEIKIVNNDDLKTIKNYLDALIDIQKKYPDKGKVFDILQKFMVDENNVDVSQLIKLDPIIEQTQNIINALIKTNVPQSLALLHLDFINAQERLIENESDIKLFDSDPIVAIGAISKFEENINSLQSTLNAIILGIKQKLNN